MTKIRQLVVISIILNIIFMNITIAETTIDSKTKDKIMVLHSYHCGLEWTDELQQGIMDSLDSSEVEVYVEYMDSYRFVEDDIQETLYAYYKEMYGGVDFSCIIITDNYAYNFMSKYYDELFNGVPIVFAGVNNFNNDMIFTEHMTGIAENYYYKEFIEQIKALHPDVKSIVIAGLDSITVVEESKTSISIGEACFNDISFSAENHDTLEGLIEALSQYDSDTVVIVVGTIQNSNGSLIDYSELTAALYEQTYLPIYGISRVFVGERGTLGSFGANPYVQGIEVSARVNRILNGEKVEDIPIDLETKSELVYNYNMLREFGIDINDLAEKSIVINNPSEEIVINKRMTFVYLGLVLALICTIVILGINTSKRMKAEYKLVKAQKDIKDNNIRLENNNKDLALKQEQLREQYIALKNSNKEIQFLLYHDTLTKLYKRERLASGIDEIITPDKKVNMVIYAISIDAIKTLDDTYGHVIGDLARAKVAESLKNELPKEPYLYGRHHDTYFVVDHSMESIDSVEYTIEILSDVLEKVIHIKGIEVELKINIGVAQYEKGDNGDDLIKKADIAVVESIRRSEQLWVAYREEFLTRIKQRLIIEKEIKGALLNNEFELYYQPQIDTITERIRGCEALLRWHREDGSITYPGYFIDVAEETGQITDIGNWVIDRAGQQIKEWLDKGIFCPISVNVSAKQVNANLVEILETTVKKYDIEPYMLIVELTETSFMDVVEYKKQIINKIRSLGFLIALDDFGSGYSSLNYIKEFPIKLLKIDKSFIDDIHDSKQEAILKVIVKLGKELDCIIIAEGVEIEEQVSNLRSLGVTEIQGWYYSKALKKEAFERYFLEINK